MADEDKTLATQTPAGDTKGDGGAADKGDGADKGAAGDGKQGRRSIQGMHLCGWRYDLLDWS